MDLMVIVNQLVQLFVIIGLGFGIGKTSLFSDGFGKNLTGFVLNITMPAMIIASVIDSKGDLQLEIFDILFATLILVVVLPIFAYFCSKAIPERENRSLYMFMIMYPNVGFMGFPLMMAIFGNESVLSTAIINMGFNMSLFSIGKMVMQGRNNCKNGLTFDLRSLLSPGIIASVLAITIYALNIQIGETIAKPIASVGSMTTPLAMIIIGLTLSQYSWKSIFSDFRVYRFTILGNVIVPVIFYPVLNYFIKDPMILGISLIILAMPVANNAALFAKNYGADEFLAAKTVFITTILSIITIPIVIYLFL